MGAPGWGCPLTEARRFLLLCPTAHVSPAHKDKSSLEELKRNSLEHFASAESAFTAVCPGLDTLHRPAT